MKPKVMEFAHDTELLEEVNKLFAQGVSKEKIYVMSDDNIRDKKVPDSVDESTFDAYVDSLGTLSEHTFREKGKDLTNQLEKIGFDQSEIDTLEGKLDEGKILLIHKE